MVLKSIHKCLNDIIGHVHYKITSAEYMKYIGYTRNTTKRSNTTKTKM